MPVVRLEGVTKFFKYERKKRMAVQDIDLTIEQGEFVFLNGSSGITGANKETSFAVHLSPSFYRQYCL